MDEAPLQQETDEELLARLRQADSDAFTRIYERYHRMLYLLALHYLQGSDMAEDAVQQVFTRLWEGHATTVISTSLRNYLFTMMKNGLLNTIRNENSAVEKNYQLAYAQPDYEDTLLEKLEEKERRHFLWRAISTLPEQKRQVCVLKLDGTLSNQEIADRLHLSVSTVKTHYLQSVKLLRERLRGMLTFVIGILLSLGSGVN